LRPSRYSDELIKGCESFGINYIGEDLVVEADFCGIYSGRDRDKLNESGLSLERRYEVARTIAESPWKFECVLREIHRIREHNVFVAEVVRALRTRKASRQDWLYHDEFQYYSRGRALGELFEIGKD